MIRYGKPLLVLDANILIRAVLGSRVRNIIFSNQAHARFFAPDVAYSDARTYLPGLFAKRGLSAESAMNLLEMLEGLVRPLSLDAYGHMQVQALQRIGGRDADDWPIVASALVLDCPIWTEDQAFFGTGVPTWTTDRVELYLKNKG